jgi:flagellar export protein FliJ
MPFQFRLESLLTYRRYQLDQCRQLMADVLRDRANCEESLENLRGEREQSLEFMRNENSDGQVNVRRMASLRYDVSRLDQNKRELMSHFDRYEHQLELCRQAVQQADAAVKALERLKEKQQKADEAKQIQKSEIELQDAWAAVNLRS